MMVMRLLPLLFLYDVAFAEDELRSRFMNEIGSSTDIEIVVFSKRGQKLTRFGRPKLELTLGLLHSDSESRGFVSAGPVWQHLSFSRFGVFINELSFAPTVLSAGKLENRDMGGVLQFTTGLGVGWKPRLQSPLYVGLRVQHISNGSIHQHNPGMASFGLELVWIPAR